MASVTLAALFRNTLHLSTQNPSPEFYTRNLAGDGGVKLYREVVGTDTTIHWDLHTNMGCRLHEWQQASLEISGILSNHGWDLQLHAQREHPSVSSPTVTSAAEGTRSDDPLPAFELSVCCRQHCCSCMSSRLWAVVWEQHLPQQSRRTCRRTVKVSGEQSFS